MNAGQQTEEAERHRLIRVTSKRLFWSLSVLLLAITVCVVASMVTSQSTTVLIVMLAGAVGGFISLQRRLTSLSLADLRLLASSKLFSFLAPFVGAVLALLLYLLFLSDLLTGDLFPKFVPDGDIKPDKKFSDIFLVHSVDFKSYSKVVIWSFIAGYSEGFVINILGKLEGKNQ